MSPSNTNKNFAVAGVGNIGGYIVRALSTVGANVIVLTRQASADKNLPAGVQSFAVNYDDPSSITSLLKEHKIDVVISALPGSGLSVQTPLADAAKAAGVKLFVPSEYGVPTQGADEKKEGNAFAAKDAFVGYLKKIGLPYTSFYVGLFITYIPWLIAHDHNGKVNIKGKGEAEFSITHPEDIGGFVAHVLTSSPPSAFENKALRLQGERVTMLSIARTLNLEPVFVESVPGKDDKEVNFRNAMQSTLEAGWASTGWDRGLGREGSEEAGSSNKLWEGHAWKTLKDSVKL